MNSPRPASILKSVLIACALAIGSLTSTQSTSAQSSTVNIPFSFQAPTQILPAGMYRIDRGSEYMILLRGAGHAEFVVTWDVIKSHAPDHEIIIFDRLGNKYSCGKSGWGETTWVSNAQ